MVTLEPPELTRRELNASKRAPHLSLSRKHLSGKLLHYSFRGLKKTTHIIPCACRHPLGPILGIISKLFILNKTRRIPVAMNNNITDVSYPYPSSSVIFDIPHIYISTHWYWNFSCFILYYYPTVHNALAFLHSFLLLVTGVKGTGPKRRKYLHSVSRYFS